MKTNYPDSKPELLAPCGSLEAFFAAMEAGADAVYAGLREFSARARAKNFTMGQMGRMLAFAHGLDRKIYVTINTLVKERELEGLVDTLAELALLKVDGIIVQDMAVARIARRHFPSIPLHASTQMTIHNLAGVRLLEELGFERVVLARELQLENIAAIAAQSKAELEIFIHGALCFSISGQCHFSSILGGHSGNRGRCAQPCRRLYSHRSRDGYFFSPNDLSAIELVPDLARAGVKSLKIEGRMKSADYVAKVVGAYRLLLDSSPESNKAALSKAKEMLKDSFGRSPTKGFITAADPADIVNPWMRGGTGRFAGEIKRVAQGRIFFEARDPLHAGDRLRLQPKSDMAGQAWTARELFVGRKKVMECGARALVEVTCPFEARPGDAVFKVGSADAFGLSDEAANRRLKSAGPDTIPLNLALHIEGEELVIRASISGGETVSRFHLGPLEPARSADMEQVLKARFGETGETTFRLESLTAPEFPRVFIPPARLKEIRRELYRELESDIAGRIRRTIGSAKARAVEDLETARKTGTDHRREELLLVVPTPADIRWGLAKGAAEVLVPLCRAAIHSLARQLSRLSADATRIRWQLPFILFDRDLPFILEGIKELYCAGFRNFEVNNPSHFILLRGFEGLNLSAGYRLFSLNSQAVAAWQELGVERCTCYLEDDRENLADLLSLQQRLSVTVYGPVDVMATRIRMKEVSTGVTIRSDRGEEYTVRGRDGLNLISSVTPVSLIGRLSELRGMGCSSFTIDLTETPSEPRDSILDSFRSDRAIPGTTVFNYDRGLQ